MNVIKSLNFKKMLDEVMLSDSPEEIHDLFTDFLGGEFETEGAIRYRSVDVKYYVGYVEENREILFELTMKDRLDVENDEPVWSLKMRLRRDAMSYLYKDLKGMIAMVR